MRVFRKGAPLLICSDFITRRGKREALRRQRLDAMLVLWSLPLAVSPLGSRGSQGVMGKAGRKTRKQKAFLAVSLVLLLLGISAWQWGGAGREEEPTEAPLATPTSVLTSTSTPQPPATATPIIYVVQSGDTLASIADRYNTTAEAICAFNKLPDCSLIRPRQELLIPSEVVPSPTKPAPSPNVATPESPLPSPVTDILNLWVKAFDTLYEESPAFARCFITITAAVVVAVITTIWRFLSRLYHYYDQEK